MTKKTKKSQKEELVDMLTDFFMNDCRMAFPGISDNDILVLANQNEKVENLKWRYNALLNLHQDTLQVSKEWNAAQKEMARLGKEITKRLSKK